MPQSRSEIFASLGRAARVWAVASIHGEAERLAALHRLLAERFAPGDRLVYLGNYLGLGERIIETMDELLLFRRELLCLPGMEPEDIVYLRGAQEEIWRKLLQIQMAPDPREVFRWMMRQGAEATLRAYGGSAADFEIRAREGIMALTRWTAGLRERLRAHPGHDELLTALRRAAFSDGRELLLVHAGVDPSRPFSEQNDTFWWGNGYFPDMAEPFDGFRLTVAGYDRLQRGPRVGPYSAIIDGGCGRGGKLVAACFDLTGQTLGWLEA